MAYATFVRVSRSSSDHVAFVLERVAHKDEAAAAVPRSDLAASPLPPTSVFEAKEVWFRIHRDVVDN